MCDPGSPLKSRQQAAREHGDRFLCTLELRHGGCRAFALERLASHRTSSKPTSALGTLLTPPSAELKEATGMRSSTPAAPPAAPTPPPPTPPSSDSGPPISRSGLLTIRVIEAKALSLPAGVVLPQGIKQALEQGEQISRRDSVQRKQLWWLP